ncbi:malectin domain-containing carbohydrate-binding protein [uncultured Tateyamaria sp.]|uniref:malectin domain-containing carbohydrate-binding protein n=1 Tax=uncultured Tateyamaria sp. TaxID=455651 RepID=UPI0026155950|nr:malectin domain-containing carbohydrate-binding protein [uncultured Tateyamaria sp.]
MFELATDHISPLSVATYDPTTGDLYLEFDYARLLDTNGEWSNGRHIDAVTFMGNAYPIIIHDDDGPRDQNGQYIFNENTVDNVFTINVGAGHDPANGTLSFGLSDREDGTRELFTFELDETEDTTGDEDTVSDEDPLPTLVYAVNAGGDAFTAGNGVKYQANDFNNGRSHQTGADIAGTTTNDALYQSERWNANVVSYELEVDNGTYDVELNFAEIWSGAATSGKRVFDVFVEDELVFNDLDVADEVGFNTALDLVGQVTVDDGSLTIRISGEVQNPKISGFSVWEAEEIKGGGFSQGSLYDDLVF